PPSKAAITEEEQKIVAYFCIERSYVSPTNPLPFRLREERRKRHSDFGQNRKSTLILIAAPRDIMLNMLYRLRPTHPDSRPIPLPTFLKYSPKNIKRAKRKTDLCGICAAGKTLKLDFTENVTLGRS